MLNIQKNVPMAQCTTFRIGGSARFFVEVATVEELKEALDYGKANDLEFFILGGGSNLLVSDKGFGGLVVKMKLNGFKVAGNNIETDSGIPLARVVSSSINEGLTGMEWAAGIPGTVGGAIRGNAGAFGGDTGSVIESVRIINTDNLQITTYSQPECVFGYRDSVFKNSKNLIILSAVIKLAKGAVEDSRKKMQEIIQQRISRQPKGVPSAGSFFVNPVVDNLELIKEFEKESGKTSKGGKVPAPWIIEKSGLKGRKIGGAMVSDVHANYIVNTGNATAEDVLMLASLVKQQVRDKFRVQLKEEVQLLGF